MSYPPAAFLETNAATLRARLAAAEFGILVTTGPDGPLATHLPFLFEPSIDPSGVLLCHVARNNPQAKTAPRTPALAILPGPHAYVSPGWYATKAADPRVVPTWNYSTLHVHGPLEAFDDADALRNLVTRLTDRQETTAGTGWRVTDAPEDYIGRMLRGIVGLRLTISRIDGRDKLNQNRAVEDQVSVAAALGRSEREDDRAVAALMKPQQKA